MKANIFSERTELFNKNAIVCEKAQFIWHFARFALPLASPKVLSLEN